MKKRYWLRGVFTAFALYGLFAVFLVLLNIFSLGPKADTGPFHWLLQPIFDIFSYLPNLIDSLLPVSFWRFIDSFFCPPSYWICLEASFFVTFVMIFIEFLLLGAFLGWLYGKIKNR